ncbi:phosphohydrolase [Halalkalibacter akibai JCM 9157]|uniref:Phosphohydrolase n=1 Tax=Halalkalibacter akibai (strain ATCC 43226 / DSM 21942 / CIP 109018 / JCM 9157 / 1139) TaxID=1236973 RepID=W4QT62_HALA3|nr:pyridoxamine 5'-phosphate oxidase family protein [Halalkalibacter akibai]GAE34823.1 phosphohydrolase [Halalkalibacter akibai JCM 9157]
MKPFNDKIETEEELQNLLGQPSELVRNKTIDFLDDHCKDFISRSPILFMATGNKQGSDVSPRGDYPGFVKILTERFLLIPERPGNKKMDTMRNILANPKVGLIFIIPGLGETLRVNGKASLIKDKHLLAQMSIKGKQPLIAIAVEVEECFIHCAKAFKRSKLWDVHEWPEKETLPPVAEILKAHAKIPGLTTEEITKNLNESYTKRLY